MRVRIWEYVCSCVLAGRTCWLGQQLRPSCLLLSSYSSLLATPSCAITGPCPCARAPRPHPRASSPGEAARGRVPHTKTLRPHLPTHKRTMSRQKPHLHAAFLSFCTPPTPHTRPPTLPATLVERGIPPYTHPAARGTSTTPPPTMPTATDTQTATAARGVTTPIRTGGLLWRTRTTLGGWPPRGFPCSSKPSPSFRCWSAGSPRPLGAPPTSSCACACSADGSWVKLASALVQNPVLMGWGWGDTISEAGWS